MGKSVILVGRTESKLKSTASEIGATAYYILDTGDVKSIPSFVGTVTKEHPEVNCLICNAGVQRPFQALGPDDVFDLDKADQGFDINIRGPLHLSLGLLPHFNSLPNGGVIMNISSVLGHLPHSVINPVYDGTKAWVHMFSMDLRTQLAQAGSKVRVVEIVPPSVETDRHRERKDPDNNKRLKGAELSLTIQEFMEDVVEGWKSDSDTVAAGSGKALVKEWYDAYGEEYRKATGSTR